MIVFLSHSKLGPANRSWTDATDWDVRCRSYPLDSVTEAVSPGMAGQQIDD